MTEEEITPERRRRSDSALARLGLSDKEGRIPYVQGLETADCGAACLGMVVGYFGRHETLATMHEIMQPGRDGVTARSIIEAAANYGLVARALSVPVNAWKDLERASILHWGFNHFVVFERFDRKGAWLLDPAAGRRRVDMEEFRRSFTGVAISFTRGERFERREAEKSKTWDVVSMLLKERPLLVRIVVTSLMLQVIGLIFPALTSLIIDRVLPRGDSSLLNLVGIGVILILVAQNLAELIRSYLLANLKVLVDSKMMLSFIEHLLALPYAFFQRHTDGDLLMRLSSNAMIREVLTGGLLSALLDGGMVFGYLLILFAVNPLIGVIVLIATALTIAPFLLTRTYGLELVTQAIERRKKSESLEVEMLRAVETIKAMGMEAETIERWSNFFVDTINIELRRDRLTAMARMFEEGFRAATPLVVLWVGSHMVLRGEIHAGEMLALSTLAGLYISRVSTLSASARSLQMLSRYVERIVDVMDTAVEQTGRRTAVASVRGEILAKNLFFRYGPSTPPVIDDLSLHIHPGAAVAFVGGSGSGKSTLIKLFAGLYQATSGDIQLDNISLNELDLIQYRKRIAVVSQETQLFAGSIRHNIALSAREVTMNEVITAAKLACIHDDIVAMPMGYETVLSDQGRSLSGGQRQRLALARALVRQPRLLLLDEATSAIDTLTEEKIKRHLDNLGACTRLIVAHRLSTIRDVHHIYVLAAGKIVEHGNHDQLMAAGQTYAQMVQAQNTPS